MQTVIQLQPAVQLPFLKHNVDIETQRMARSVGLLVFLEDNSIPLVWHWTQSTKLEFDLTDRGGWELAARAMVPFLECLQNRSLRGVWLDVGFPNRNVVRGWHMSKPDCLDTVRCWMPKAELFWKDVGHQTRISKLHASEEGVFW